MDDGAWAVYCLILAAYVVATVVENDIFLSFFPWTIALASASQQAQLGGCLLPCMPESWVDRNLLYANLKFASEEENKHRASCKLFRAVSSRATRICLTPHSRVGANVVEGARLRC